MSFDQRALWALSYGLYVVSSRDDGNYNGQIANAVIQVTADPPKLAVALNKKNYTHQCVVNSGLVSISVLDRETPMKMIGLFGFKSGRDIDKMSQCKYKIGSRGCPIVIDHSVSTIEGMVVDSVDVGTHTVFIVEVTGGEVLSDKKPMTYAYYHEHLKGKAQENAPTYRGDVKTKQSGGNEMQEYVCDICGYVYDPEEGDPDSGIEPGTPFKDLPDDWVCPVCGAGKEDFSPVE